MSATMLLPGGEWRLVHLKPAPNGARSCFMLDGRSFHAATWRKPGRGPEKSVTRRCVILGTLVVLEVRQAGEEVELRVRACPQSVEGLS